MILPWAWAAPNGRDVHLRTCVPPFCVLPAPLGLHIRIAPGLR